MRLEAGLHNIGETRVKKKETLGTYRTPISSALVKVVLPVESCGLKDINVLNCATDWISSDVNASSSMDST